MILKLKTTWSITPHLTNQKPIVIYITVGFNQKLFKTNSHAKKY